MWRSMLQDLKEGVAMEIIAARFHHVIINAVAGQALWLTSEHNINTVVLSGGHSRIVSLQKG